MIKSGSTPSGVLFFAAGFVMISVNNDLKEMT